MSSQYLSTQPPRNIQGIIFYGFPLHPSGKPSTERAEHLKLVKVPMLFLQGTRDELGTYELVKEVTAPLKRATVVEIAGANHAFKAGKQDLIPVLASNTKTWIEKKLKKVKQA